jgi:hypothetical protein
MLQLLERTVLSTGISAKSRELVLSRRVKTGFQVLKNVCDKRKSSCYVAAVAFTAGAAVVAFTTGAAVVAFTAGATVVAFTAGADVVSFTEGAAGVAITNVGVAGGVAAGVWLVHPAKQAAINSMTNIVEINPTCISLLIILPE